MIYYLFYQEISSDNNGKSSGASFSVGDNASHEVEVL
jgi:hypothetical protein